MSKLLINENPLQVLPSLAVAIGLNQAIFLQQVHYWLHNSGKTRDGRRWIYNSAESWQKQFPFWCTRTIKSIIMSLEGLGILVSGNYNAAKFDKTKWYTIDYDKLDKICQSRVQELHDDSAKSARSYRANVARPIPENTENTTEIFVASATVDKKRTTQRSKNSVDKYPPDTYKAIEDAFSKAYTAKTGREYKHASIPIGRKAIKSLLQSGADPGTIADMAREYVDRADGKYRAYTIQAFVRNYNDIQASAPMTMSEAKQQMERTGGPIVRGEYGNIFDEETIDAW